jgi:hypothetical protein
MTTSNLPQSTVIHYDKNFIKNMKAETPFVRCTTRRELPENSGNQLRLYMYNPLGPNITNVAEGTVGSGITVSVVANTATIGQLADYVSMSDFSMVTAIDPALENIQKELAYRLGQSLSIIVRNAADALNATDPSVGAGSLPAATPFGKSVITTAIQSLAGRNVKAFDRGRFASVIHPFVVGDALNDVSNNSLTDVLKHTVEGQMKLEELPAPDGDQVQVMEWAGCTFYQSTLVTQTPNYQAGTKTALRTYFFGEDGIISVSLGKREGTAVGDGDWRNLQLWLMKAEGPSISDPSRVIGGYTSYNSKFTATPPPDTTARVRWVDSVSNIS